MAGRPKKSADERMEKEIHTSVTQMEHEAARHKADSYGLTVSELVRNLLNTCDYGPLKKEKILPKGHLEHIQKNSVRSR